MLSRFAQDEALRVATDSIYVQKTAVHKVEGVETYVAVAGSPSASLALSMCRATPVAPGKWRDKGELTFLPKEHAAYLPGPGFKATKKDLSQRRAALRRSAVEVSAVIPQWRRGLRQDHASDLTLPPEESLRLYSDPSHGERNADPGRPDPDLSQLISLEWPDRMDTRKDG